MAQLDSTDYWRSCDLDLIAGCQLTLEDDSITLLETPISDAAIAELNATLKAHKLDGTLTFASLDSNLRITTGTGASLTCTSI